MMRNYRKIPIGNLMGRLNIYLFFSFCFFYIQFIQAQVQFTADVTTGCKPLVVKFTDNSPEAVSWEWTLGNGSASQFQHPGIAYIDAGTYDIKLVITKADGSKDSLIKTNYINVLNGPPVSINPDKQLACVGEEIRFSSNATPSFVQITEWSWDFGDGNASSEAAPTHVYENPGAYTITVSIKDSQGCQSILTQNKFIEVKPIPSAEFSVEPAFSCQPPANVSFNSAQTDPSFQHFWDFGTGSISNQPNPVHSYPDMGSFDVLHVISSSNGCVDSIYKTSAVQIGNNDFSFDNPPLIACTNQSVRFDLTAPPSAWIEWDLGNGIKDTARPRKIFTFDTPGTYTITARLLSEESCTPPVSTSIEINTFSNSSFNVNPKAYCEFPVSINFTPTANDAVSYRWILDNKLISQEPFPTVIFDEEGTHQVKLVSTFESGCTSEYEDTIEVYKPVKEILASTVSGCSPLKVNFNPVLATDQQISNIVWDFGNGETSTELTPSYTYTEAGTFQVKAILSTASGCSETLQLDQIIFVGTPPKAEFGAKVRTSCVENGIQFTNNSANADSALWIFGDGQVSGAWEPSHVYTDTGLFTVSLIISDRGCRDTMIEEDFIRILPPRASFSVTEDIGCQLPYQLDIKNTSIGADTYRWDFGDGSNSTDKEPNHTYTSGGEYNIVLEVTNDETGCTHIADFPMTISSIKADFDIGDVDGCAPVSVQFTDVSEGAEKWNWNFGTNRTSNKQHPIIAFSTGTYDVSLIVSNQEGCTDTLTQEQAIKVNGPKFNFTSDVKNGCAPLSVKFTANNNGETNISQWNWTFGDGKFSSAQHPSHSYKEGGVYTVSLEAIDEGGCSAKLEKKEYIHVFEPKASFDIPLALSCKEFPVKFRNTSQGSNFTYYWDFGDGTTSTSPNPSHTYTSDGAYDISFAITDGAGCTDTLTQINAVRIRALEASFTASDTFADCPPLLTEFSSPNTEVDSIVGWHWEFGNGSSSSEKYPSHLYPTAGVYDVSLAIEDKAGCRDTLLKRAYIRINGPSGSFSAAPLSGCPPLEVSFTSLTQDAISFQWDMDDGTLLEGESPTYTYTTSGVYTPRLILEDEFGCQVLLSMEDPIDVFTPPVASFNLADSIGCLEIPVVLSAGQSEEKDIISWQWNLGDGSTAKGQTVEHIYQEAINYDISLLVEDAQGCKDTLISKEAIRILENIVPSPSDIHVASVQSNTEISLTFAPYLNSRNDFSAYHILRKTPEAGYELIGTIKELMDTIYTDDGVDALEQVYCYKVQVENKCKLRSDLTQTGEHCTIELSTTPLQDQILLNWNAYKGWAPKAYQIFRVSDYQAGNMKFLARVDGNTLAYLDKEMDCYEEFSYRIQAVQNLPYSSLSDSAKARPFHDPPTEKILPIYATVENDTAVKLEWFPPIDPGLNSIILERKKGSAFQLLTSFEPPNEIDFIDNTADVHQLSYTYRLFAQDTCGDLTPLGRIARSILLQASISAGRILLDWNLYRKWENDARIYHLEVFDESKNDFITVATLEEGITDYTDTYTYLSQAAYCYRIIAFEKEGNEAESVSNLACVTPPPLLFVPNAFSPNDDGTNDYFRIQGPFVEWFHLKIFNRWGEKIYETYNLEQGWSGKTYSGESVPEGVYVYTVEGAGYDNQVIRKAGTVTVIR